MQSMWGQLIYQQFSIFIMYVLCIENGKYIMIVILHTWKCLFIIRQIEVWHGKLPQSFVQLKLLKCELKFHSIWHHEKMYSIKIIKSWIISAQIYWQNSWKRKFIDREINRINTNGLSLRPRIYRISTIELYIENTYRRTHHIKSKSIKYYLIKWYFVELWWFPFTRNSKQISRGKIICICDCALNTGLPIMRYAFNYFTPNINIFLDINIH